MSRSLLLHLVVTVAIFCGSCSKLGSEKIWDNPHDPDGVNRFPITLQLSDTLVAINEIITLNLSGYKATKGVDGYLCSFDKGITWDTLLQSTSPKHSWNISEIGRNLVLVRPIDTTFFTASPDSFYVDVHSFKPIVKHVHDTVVAKKDSVIKTVTAFDTNCGTLNYFWFIQGNDRGDTTDKPEYVFTNQNGGPIKVRWGAIDKDGNTSSDTFSILFNRPPKSLKMLDPISDKAVAFTSYNYTDDEGSVRFNFSGEDPDGDSDTLTYRLSIGTKPDSLKTAYSGRETTYIGYHFHSASDYFWKLQARDLFGDSIEIKGVFATAESLPSPRGMKFIRSKDKSFVMGQSGTDSSELPLHTVAFTYNFWMDSSEVTAHDFSAALGFIGSSSSGASLPAANCTWFDAALYCNARGKSESRDTVYSYKSIFGEKGNGCVLAGCAINMAALGYRLPTEAEWEYACRGATQSTFFWGDSQTDAGSYAWTLSNSKNQMQFVATKKPNAFGLYDMSGNVAEWCNDWFTANYYSQSSLADPIGPETGKGRVIRGGSFQDDISFAACAKRRGMSPDASSVSIGFRTVLISR